MLKKITLNNFQAHKNLEIEFSDTVTTIVGPSDVGKSAVIRAIQLVSLNQPAGDAYIKEGTKQAVVELEFEKGKVKRVRGKGENSYSLNEQGYNAFGNDVPETIQKALNISKLNFQSQHDAPFWFSETAGEVSRQLNSIINLDVIDTTLANIAASVRKQKTTKEVIEKRIKDLILQRKALKYIKELNSDFKQIESLSSQKEETALKQATIDELYKGATKYRTAIKNLLDLIVDGKNAVLKGDSYSKLQKKVNNLRKLVGDYKEYKKISEFRPSLPKNIQNSVTSIDNISKRISILSGLVRKAEQWESETEKYKTETKRLKKQMKDEMGGLCPLCNQPLP